MSREADLIYEINTHMLYELEWMIYAAAEIAKGEASHHVALIDSATVHGRNLFEFAALKSKKFFTLAALDGTPKQSKKWKRWANNRVTHMHMRERDRPPWPAGLTNDRSDRFMVMAGIVLDRLEDGGRSIPPGPVKDAYDAVLGAARRYHSTPSETNFDTLAKLYDDSKDDRSY